MRAICFIVFVIILILFHCAYNSIVLYNEINSFNGSLNKEAMEYAIEKTCDENYYSYCGLLMTSSVLAVLLLL